MDYHHPDIYDLCNIEISAERVKQVVKTQHDFLLKQRAYRYNEAGSVYYYAIWQCKEILEQNLSVLMVLLEDPSLAAIFYNEKQILQELIFKANSKMSPKQIMHMDWYTTGLADSYKFGFHIYFDLRTFQFQGIKSDFSNSEQAKQYINTDLIDDYYFADDYKKIYSKAFARPLANPQYPQQGTYEDIYGGQINAIEEVRYMASQFVSFITNHELLLIILELKKEQIVNDLEGYTAKVDKLIEDRELILKYIPD